MFASLILNNKCFSEVLSKVTSPYRMHKVASLKELQDFHLYAEIYPSNNVHTGFQNKMCGSFVVANQSKPLEKDLLMSIICKSLSSSPGLTIKLPEFIRFITLIEKCNKTAYFADSTTSSRLYTALDKLKKYKTLPIYSGTDDLLKIETEYLTTFGASGGYIIRRMRALVAAGIIDMWCKLPNLQAIVETTSIYGSRGHSGNVHVDTT